MAKIRVDLTEPLLNGMDIKFKAPGDCTAVDGMTVYAPDNDGNVSAQSFVFKDAHGNTLTGLGNLFAKGVLVKVMVDTETGAAYIQNADTNKYLEDKMGNMNYIPISQKGAKSGVASLDANGRVPTSQLPSMTDTTVTVYTNALSGLMGAQESTTIHNQEVVVVQTGGFVHINFRLEVSRSNASETLALSTRINFPQPKRFFGGFHGVCKIIFDNFDYDGQYSWYDLTTNGSLEIKMTTNALLTANNHYYISGSFGYMTT